MADVSYISSIQLPSGSTYVIKDSEARELIEGIQADLTGALTFVGVTTTALTDGATTSPITIDGSSYTPVKGDVVVYGKKEFVFSAAGAWIELGDFSDLQSLLGNLAYKDEAKGSYTPAGQITLTPANEEISVAGSYTPEGSVSQPTFNGSEGNVSVSGEYNQVTAVNGTFTGTKGDVSVDGSVVAKGDINALDFTGTPATISSSGTFTPAGDVDVAVTTATAPMTSTGSVTVVTGVSSKFTGSAVTISSTGVCIPQGKVSKPAVTVEAPTASSTFLTSASVSNEVLTIGTGSVTYVTSVDAELAATPTFTGESTDVGVSASYTPNGTVANTYESGSKSISVTGDYIKVDSVGATFRGTEGTVGVAASYTPAGSITQPVFTGTTASFTAGGTFTPAGTIANTVVSSATAITSTGKFTPAGTVTKPTFTGTLATITSTGTVATAGAATFSGTAATITVQ